VETELQMSLADLISGSSSNPCPSSPPPTTQSEEYENAPAQEHIVREGEVVGRGEGWQERGRVEGGGRKIRLPPKSALLNSKAGDGETVRGGGFGGVMYGSSMVSTVSSSPLSSPLLVGVAKCNET